MIFHIHCPWALSTPQAALMSRFVNPEQKTEAGVILLQFVFAFGVSHILFPTELCLSIRVVSFLNMYFPTLVCINI